jgi:uncharacterized membrane protein
MTGTAIASVAGITALDIYCAAKMSNVKPGRIEASVVISRTPEDCYTFWRNIENLPRFLEYVDSVRMVGERRSHWVAHGLGGRPFEWDAEITGETPGRRIAWNTTAGRVCQSGSVEFNRAPGDRGTIVRVHIDLHGPSKLLAAGVARLTGMHPEQMVYKDLRRFKAVMETGEAITTEGQPAGRRSGATWLDQIAR